MSKSPKPTEVGFIFTPLFTLSLSATLLMIGVGMIVALLPQKVFATTGSLESAGLVASVFAFAYLLAQLPVGILADRFGVKRFLVAGYITCGIAGLVFVTAQTAPMIYLGRAIQGLGEAPIWALGPALLSLAYPDAKGRAIGIYNASIHGGLTLGPLLGLLVAKTGTSTLPFLIFACLCFSAGAVVLLFLANSHVPKRAAPRVNNRNFTAILRQRKVVIILFGIFLYGSCYGVFVSVLPISLTKSHGFSEGSIAAFFVVFYAAISLAQLTAGPISDRIGRRGFMIWGMVLASIGIAAVAWFPNGWVFIPICVASIGLGLFCVTSIAELNGCVEDNLKGTISGAYYFFWAMGYMLGPLVVGWLMATMPTGALLGIAGILGIYSIVIWRAEG
jgi:MFS family permease